MKRVYYLTGCSLLGVGLIFLLYVMAAKANSKPNGFIRLFPPHRVTPVKILDLHNSSYYVAGGTGQHIYLGDYTAPGHVLVVNHALTDTQQLQLALDDRNTLVRASCVLTIDSPDIYMLEGRTPEMLYGTLPSGLLHRMPDSIHFIASQPLSPASFVIRVFSDRLKRNILAKQVSGSRSLRLAPEVLEKQLDGLFCTDGMLYYERNPARLVYTYFYRNQFICLDTNLKVLNRYHTIDTISHVQIAVSDLQSKGTSTISAPPVTVNRKSCIAGDRLYVNSGLLANNEDKKDFDRWSVIDVYSLTNGKYEFSFYLPDYRDKKMRSFRIFDHMLVALYDRYLYSFRLNF
jgi:hypothetical protein